MTEHQRPSERHEDDEAMTQRQRTSAIVILLISTGLLCLAFLGAILAWPGWLTATISVVFGYPVMGWLFFRGWE